MSRESTTAGGGKVWIIGAGPGDPELLTLKAVRAIGQADVILVDGLVNRAMLSHARRDARVIDVSKRGGRPSASQGFIERMMIRFSRLGACVARLKGGDPMIFGRGGDEIRSLIQAGISFEVVPGITAGIGAAAAAGIALTLRGVSRAVTLVTGATTGAPCRGAAHSGTEAQPMSAGTSIDWRPHAASGATLVLYMGMTRLDSIVAQMIAGGFAPDTPACAIQNATLSHQREVVAPLAQLAAGVEAAGLGSPGVVVIGEVVRATQRWRATGSPDTAELQAA